MNDNKLKQIRDYLRHCGFVAAVEEINDYLREQSKAEQPDLFPGPLFEEKSNGKESM